MRRWLVLVALLGLSALGIYFLGSVLFGGLFVTGTIGKVVNDLANASGWSRSLIQGLAIIATVPFFWAVAKYTKTWWGFSPVRPSLNLYLNKHGIVIVLYVAVYFLTMHLASRASFVDQQGKAMKFCSESPEGIRVFDAPGFDPVYGTPLKPCTDDQIRALRQAQVGFSGPRPVNVDDPRTYEFFDGATSRPRIWYSRALDARIRLFDRPGADPTTGNPLIPVDASVVRELIGLHDQRQRDSEATKLAQQREAQAAESLRQTQVQAARAADAARQERERLALYLNPGPANDPAKTEVALVASELPLPADLRLAILDGIRPRGLEPLDSLFRPAFISHGFAERLANGDMGCVRDLRLSERVDAVLITRLVLMVSENPQAAGMSRANLSLDIRCVRTGSPRSCGILTLTSVGAGFSTETAQANAVERLLPSVRERVEELQF